MSRKKALHNTRMAPYMLLLFQKMEVESMQLGGAAGLGGHPKVTPLDRSAWI